MKTITKHTILKQGDKVYQPVEVDGVIYWISGNQEQAHHTIAQSLPILKSIPVISLDSYVERLGEKDANKFDWDFESSFGNGYADHVDGFVNGFKSNPNKWTDEDMEKAIEIALELGDKIYTNPRIEILKIVSSISFIEVDENFNVINFK